MAGTASELRHLHGLDLARDRDREHDDDHALDPGKLTRASLAPTEADPGASRAGDVGRLRASLASLDGGGAPLPESAAAKYAPLLGADLSAVRIHASGPASDAAASMGARALTHGAHIAFAPGAYDAGAAAHDHVLAHELVHVVQNQRSGGAAMELAARLDVGPSGSAIEGEAEAGAAALTAGQPFAVTARGALPGISLFDGPGPAPSTPTPTPSTKPAPPATAPGAGNATAPTGDAKAPTATPPATAPGATPTPAPTTPGATPGAAPAPTAPAPTGAAPGATAPGGAAPSATPAPTVPAIPKPDASGPAKPGAAIDAKVAAILEQRADPKSKADYAQTMGAIMALRLTATQYSFVNSNVGHTLVQMVWPSDAIGDHVGQIGKLNQYRGEDPGGGTSFWGGVQKTIESLRGVLHILGDLAAALSALAGVVALAAAAVAAVCAISVIGLAGPAEVAAGIAAIADAIATAAALVKIAADLIDMILGVLQMVILVFRARAAKGDPAQRARFAQLLHKEAGDFSANLVGVVVQVGVLLATAGAGSGAGKALGKDLGRSVGAEAKEMLPRAALNTLKKDLPAGMQLIKRGLADTKAGVKIGTAEAVRAGVAPGTKAVLKVEDELAMVSVLARKGGKVIKGKGGVKLRKLVEFEGEAARGTKITVLNSTKFKYIGLKSVGGLAAAAQTTQFIVDAKAPTAPSTPGEVRAPAKPGAPAGGSLATVQMWPSQIDAFKTELNLVPNAREHVEEQAENAKTQLGPELGAQFEAAIKKAIAKREAAKAAAEGVKGDAAESKGHNEQGAATSKTGADTKQKADANNAALKAKTDAATGKSETLKSPPPKEEGPLNWLYNHTIGKVGEGIGWVQSGIKNSLGKFLFYCAGYDSAELDFAGIEGEMRTAAQSDTKAGGDAAAAETAVDPVQKAVVDLQKDKTASQQQAAQGMADSLNFAAALEEAEKTLKEAIETGNAYMEAAAPLIAHEAETKAEGKAIDAAYVQPALAYADAVAASLDQDSGPAIAAAARQGFTALGAKVPGLDVATGIAAVDKAAADHATAQATLAAKGKEAAGKIKAALGAFVGTTDYEGANANALALDKLADEMGTASAALDDQMQDEINGVIDQYNAALASPGTGAPGADPAAPPPAATPPAATPGVTDPAVTTPATAPDDGAPVSRKADGDHAVSADAEHHVAAAAGGSGGAPLPGGLRGRLEGGLGADLGDVRVHTGGASNAAARAIGARAYATGQDIHFAEGAYDPDSKDGQALIAHEAAHTVQQGGGSAPAGQPQAKLAVSTPGDAHEREADQFAAAFVGGTAFSRLTAAPSTVARAPAAKPANKVVPYSPDIWKDTTAAKVTKGGTTEKVDAVRVGDVVLVQTPGVNMQGTAALKDDLDPDQAINIGWVQTVESSRRVSIYEKNGKVVSRHVTAFSSARDAKRGVTAPWYEPPAVITKDARSAFPTAEDQPKMQVPNKLDGGELTEIQGQDDFKTSLEAGPGTAVTPLKTFSWAAPWSVKLGSAASAKGGDVAISESATHEGPKGTRTANEIGQDPTTSFKTYESEGEAIAGLTEKGIQGFIADLPRHKTHAPTSYWNMVAALWKSNARFRVKVTPIDGAPDIQVTFRADFTVSLPEGPADKEYSALAHMVYDPGALAPGKFVYVMINGTSQASITFPFAPVALKDVKWETAMSTYIYNIDVSLA